MPDGGTLQRQDQAPRLDAGRAPTRGDQTQLSAIEQHNRGGIEGDHLLQFPQYQPQNLIRVGGPSHSLSPHPGA
jgi:hypothetical protein